jgi:hypothetical protein
LLIPGAGRRASLDRMQQMRGHCNPMFSHHVVVRAGQRAVGPIGPRVPVPVAADPRDGSATRCWREQELDYDYENSHLTPALRARRGI